MQTTIFSSHDCDFNAFVHDGVLSQEGVDTFQAYILDYYRRCGRDFPWRRRISPYRILVSEIMLQQTQTQRVAQKFEPFIQAFPSFTVLARSSFHDVLSYWQGLGYNRRAQGLHKTAQRVVQEFHCHLPTDVETLKTFPSIGPNTAASIATFACNTPTVFFETNIRTVFIYHFFYHHPDVSDEQLRPLVEQTLHRQDPRVWYYALMDYGVWLKQQYGNFNRQSKHYTTQSKFEGSERQIRGMILRMLTQQGALSYEQLCREIPREEQRIRNNLHNLVDEGMVQARRDMYQLSS